jgi:type IV pilus assembly protein PilY1
MRRTSYPLLVSSLLAASLLSSAASAQLDVDPPIPNVLLLIDTSGSMENMIDGSRPEAQVSSKCSPGSATEMNRWAKLVQVMTGTIQGFSCYAQDRSSVAFQNEFAFLGEDPYDYKYYLPFHRILSNGCAAGPGVVPTEWYEWPAGAIKYHRYDDLSAPCGGPGWQQNKDGILDTFLDRVRFGLMTFDSLPDEGTGLAGTVLDGPSGVTGMWSYYDGWGGSGSPVKGRPPNCPTDRTMEVGARNPAAPPWEGRMMSFGAKDAPTATVKQNNDRIQEALIALRPYGATPLAGMMADAKEFLLNDATVLPPPVNEPFGPKSDPFVQGGCRNTFVILLSDGAPNLDLRDECATGDGQCPYAQPHEIAKELSTLSNPIKTFAVGFGLASAGGTDCTTINKGDFLPGGQCEAPTGALKACCTLARIAIEGDTGNAYFAEDETTLKMTLSQVLATISADSTSRTLPVFATASLTASVQGNAPARSYQFLTSFRPGIGDGTWNGIIERKRYKCENNGGVLEAKLQPIDSTKGDSFENNLNKGTPKRKFFSIIAEAYDGTKIHSMRTIRPYLLADDDLGKVNGTSTGMVDGPLFALAFQAKPEALSIDPVVPPSACTTLLSKPAAGDCAESVIKWAVGEPDVPFTRDGNELGSVYHATPAIDGPPREFLRDESYALFAQQQARRPIMLYTATTDGQLHAFQVASNDVADPLKVDKEENNELWSFLPPHVLPRILPTYNQQAFLLDGAPIVRNIVMERTAADVQAGVAAWKTVLLAGGGAGGAFYYALDVTDPTTPKFLWQLSEDKEGSPMFGSSVPTPAIATITLLDGAKIKEVAVAILPGGSAPLVAGTKPRAVSSWPNVESGYPPGLNVRCWGDASCEAGAARSLTIVRLDTGELLMNFRGTVNDGPFAVSNPKFKVVNFDSPITGTPVPYPAQVGQVANRIYVGDADGTMWRINLSSPKPVDWTAEIAWDAYSLPGDTPDIRQPIDTPPILSVDPIGNSILLFSTGDQQMFTTSTGVKTRAWSVVERIVDDHYETDANWVVPFDNGERVTGPMSLFNSVLYFATFVPNAGGPLVCDDGFSKVWGVHYTQADAATPPYPAAEFVKDVTKPNDKVFFEAQPSGTIVFGVAVTQKPSCYDTVTFDDADLGPHTAVTNASPAEFQLVFNTGAGGQATEGAQTKTTIKTLPQPRESTRISSWASIIE